MALLLNRIGSNLFGLAPAAGAARRPRICWKHGYSGKALRTFPIHAFRTSHHVTTRGLMHETTRRRDHGSLHIPV
jgi:hypothetical protein